MRRILPALHLALLLLVISPADLAAQNGRGRGVPSVPHGRPFVALQQQIDAVEAQIASLLGQTDAATASIQELAAVVLLLEARIAATDATLEDVQAYMNLQQALVESLYDAWQDAEARLLQHQDDLDALLEADQALQTLIAAVQVQADADAALLAGLEEAVAAKQQAIAGACPAGTAIRQIAADGGVVCQAVSGGGGAAGTLVVFDATDSFRIASPGEVISSRALCPSGYVATGGGFHRDFMIDVYFDGPSGNGWEVAALNGTGLPRGVRAFARCTRLAF